MRPKTVYILHKNGAKSHYLALEYLLKQNKIQLKHREFGVVGKFFKGLFSANINLFLKQFTNLYFLIGLLFTRDKKIVLGIAPYDKKLAILLKVLKNHRVFYHTSWTVWDKSFQPKSDFSQGTLNQWRYFIEQKAAHIFSVTNHSKIQLLQNYKLSAEKISVVYHSLDYKFLNYTPRKKKANSFIYIGRLIPQKGIEELLIYFKNKPDCTFTVIGEGKLENIVTNYSKAHKHIHHIPYIVNKEELMKILATQQYLVLNSKRNEKWEELFGMVIIESMSQGVIPIATMHSGPSEIISSSNGYLIEEGTIPTFLSHLIDNIKFSKEMSIAAIKTSKEYSIDNNSENWKHILEE